MKDFCEKVAEILEVKNADAETHFREVQDWDSVKGLSIILLINDDYHVELTVDQFKNCKTIADLARLAGIQG